MSKAATGSETPAEKVPTPTIRLAADSIMLMNRIVSKLFGETSLVQGKLGLAEWSLLRELAANPALKAGALSKRLDVTPQRVNQVVKSMREAGLIEVKTSTTDPRSRDITVTPLGGKRLAEAEKEVTAAFDKAFVDRTKQLPALRGSLKRIGQALFGD
jgi:DNA-binding MarR family transcriptional regulator